MAEDHMRYDILAQEALRGVVRKVLAEVSRTGLPGEHHFFISFATRAPGAAAVEAEADDDVEAAEAASEHGEEKPGEKVVSLDAFRKKP